MYPQRDLVREHDEQWITREGSMIYFPRGSPRMCRSTSGYDGDTFHQVQAVWVVVATSSVEIWSLSWLYEWARVRPKSPIPGSRIDHQGSCCCILCEARAQAWMKETKGRKISQDRGGYCWCLVPWYECMLMHIAGIPSWCSIRRLFIRVRLWVVATLPWLELAWYIWVTNSWY